jgi:hypothetical protein
MYGHIKTMAEAEKRGIEAAGGQVDMFQYVVQAITGRIGSWTALERIPESLSQEVLEKMHAPAKDSSIPTLKSPDELLQYDAFMFGIPTRYGNFPGQWKVCGTGRADCRGYESDASDCRLSSTPLAIFGKPAATGASKSHAAPSASKIIN